MAGAKTTATHASKDAESASRSRPRGTGGGDGASLPRSIPHSEQSAPNPPAEVDYASMSLSETMFMLRREVDFEIFEVVKRRLEEEPKLDVNDVSFQGYSPLGLAIRFALVDCAELLLSRGADLRVKTKSCERNPGERFWTPLEYFHYAAYQFRIRNPTYSRLYEVLEFNHFVRRYPDETFFTITLAHSAPSNSVWDLYLDPITSMRDSEIETNMKALQSQQMVMGFYEDADEEQRIVAKESLGQRMTWMHVPSTNGVILAKISRTVEKSLQDRFDDNFKTVPDTFCRWRYLRGGQSTVPGDPLLKYQEPLYHSEQTTDGWKHTAIAFPCLTLRTVEHHKQLRSKVEKMNGLFPLDERLQEFNQIHLERTLDEAYYPGLTAETLKTRNEDQVVKKVRRSESFPTPILTVPQLWVWRLDNFVVSAFESSEDPFYDVSKELGTISPDFYIGQMLAHHIEAFGKGFKDYEYPPILNFFEILTVEVLVNVDEYMKSQLSNGVDSEKEGKFIHDISDIRNELAMIQEVLDQQEVVLDGLLNDPRRDELQGTEGECVTSDTKVPGLSNSDTSEGEDDQPGNDFGKEDWTPVLDAKKLLLKYRKRTEKIDRDAERTAQVIQDKLNLKRTAASIAEARQSKLLSIIVLGFTIITLIFTPLSFLTALFALDIDSFSSIKYTPTTSDTNATDSSQSKPDDVYSGKTITRIFVGVEFLTIIITIALTLGTGYLLLRFLDRLSSAVDGITTKKPTQQNGSNKTRLPKQDEVKEAIVSFWHRISGNKKSKNSRKESV